MVVAAAAVVVNNNNNNTFSAVSFAISLVEIQNNLI